MLDSINCITNRFQAVFRSSQKSRTQINFSGTTYAVKLITALRDMIIVFFHCLKMDCTARTFGFSTNSGVQAVLAGSSSVLLTNKLADKPTPEANWKKIAEQIIGAYLFWYKD
jgi:hypothetical protein